MGWLGNSILFLASYLLGYRKRYAFVLVAIGECIWMVRAWQLAAWDLMACCAVFFILAVKNYRMWRPKSGNGNWYDERLFDALYDERDYH